MSSCMEQQRGTQIGTICVFFLLFTATVSFSEKVSQFNGHLKRRKRFTAAGQSERKKKKEKKVK